MPAVVLLTRTTAEAYQFLELQLAAAAAAALGQPAAGDDFWSIRSRIPPTCCARPRAGGRSRPETAALAAPPPPSALSPASRPRCRR